jgi:hypothetical protein
MPYNNISDNSYYSGTHSVILNLNNIPSGWYGYRYRCVTDGVNGDIYSLQFYNSWTGAAANTQWEDPANWSCGAVPDSNTDVVINFGTVTLNSNVTVRSLLVKAGAIFSIIGPYTLTITH